MFYRRLATFSPVLLLGLILGGYEGDAQSSEQINIPVWRTHAIPLTQDISGPVADARGKTVDSLIGLPDGITLGSTQAAQQGISVSAHSRSMQELPASSDVVVVAVFTSHETHESPSQRSLYTIAKFKVDKVVTDKMERIHVGERLPILLLGGSAILPSGTAISYGIPQPDISIIPGHRYLSFLHYKDEGQYFELEKTWDLTSGRAIPNSAEDRVRVQERKSTVAGSTEQSLITSIQSKR